MVNDHAAQLSLYRGALDGNALEAFNLAYSLREDEDGAREPEDPNDPRRGEAVVLAQALNDLALQAFDEREDASEAQWHYLTHRIPIQPMDIRQWCDRLRELSNWLKYFPINTEAIHNVQPATFPQTLADADMMSTLRASAPPRWQAQILASGGPTTFPTFAKLKARYQALQQADKIVQAVQARQESSKPKNGTNNGFHEGKRHKKDKKRRPKGNDPKEKDSDDKSKRGKCEHCGRYHINPGDGCWKLEKNKHLRPASWKQERPEKKTKFTNGREVDSTRATRQEQANVMLTPQQYARLRTRAGSYSDDDDLPAASYHLAEDNYMDQLRESTRL